MSLQAMVWAFGRPIRNVGAKFVLLALAEHAREDARKAWSCFPSVRRLAAHTSQSERTVERHLSWLVENGWVSRHRRTRKWGGEGAYGYTLIADNLTGEENRGPRHDVTTNPTICPPAPDNLSAPYNEEPAKEPPIEPTRGNDEAFEAWWAEYPRQVERVGALGVFRRILDSGRATSDELIAGAQRYAVDVRGRDPRMIKHPTRWLEFGCWADESAGPHLRLVPAAAVDPQPFQGPSELWAAAVRLKGEAWAHSWLAPCSWEAANRRLLARSGFAATRITQELRATLRSLDVQIGVAAPAADTEARAAPNDFCDSKSVVSTPALRSGWG